MSVTLSESYAEGPNNTSLSEALCNHSSPKTSPPEGKKQKSKPSTGKACAVCCLEVGSSHSKKVLPALKARGDDFYMEGELLKSGGHKDFIPLDILASLTQIPSPPSKEQLGPPSKFKKNVSTEVRQLEFSVGVIHVQFTKYILYLRLFKVLSGFCDYVLAAIHFILMIFYSV